MWIDTHCHLDAPEFAHDVQAVRQQARLQGVQLCVLPSVQRSQWGRTQALAHQLGDVYALGIHPMCVPQATQADLHALDDALAQAKTDGRLVAVGETGLDFFVPALQTPDMRAKQQHFLAAQLQMARQHGLPVVLHVRRSVDAVLQALRLAAAGGPPIGGVAHAFGGSVQQAHACMAQGLALGVGGAITHSRASRLRQVLHQVWCEAPQAAWVLETDAPDMVPQWLYRTQQQRTQSGLPQARNSPAELPRMARCVADVCGVPLAQLAASTHRAALEALPRLAPWLHSAAPPTLPTPCPP